MAYFGRMKMDLPNPISDSRLTGLNRAVASRQASTGTDRSLRMTLTLLTL